MLPTFAKILSAVLCKNEEVIRYRSYASYQDVNAKYRYLNFNFYVFKLIPDTYESKGNNQWYPQ
jgi:hypothetical protein